MDRDQGSLVLTAAVGALVVGIYQTATPGIANVRVSEPNDQDLASSERMAGWLSAAVVSGVALIARDPVVFIQGSILIVGLSWWNRHANHVDPQAQALKRRGMVDHLDTIPTPASSDDNEHAGESLASVFEGAF